MKRARNAGREEYLRKQKAVLGPFQRPLPSQEVPRLKMFDTLFTGALTSPYVPDALPCFGLPIDNSDATVQCLNLMPQGIGERFRQGDRIIMKRLRLRLRLTYEEGYTVFGTAYRIALVYFRQGQAYITPTVAFADQSNAGLTDGEGFSDLSPALDESALVLRDDWRHTPALNFNPGVGGFFFTSVASDERTMLVDWDIDLPDLLSSYNDTKLPQPAIDTVELGQLCLMVFSPDDPSSNIWGFQGSARLWFVDA